jgi:PAS domain S-box-containing protein
MLEQKVEQRTVELREINARLENELVERRMLSEALRQSDEAVMVTDPDLHLIHVNRAFERLFDYKAADVVGQSVTMFAPLEGVSPLETTRIALEQSRFRGETIRRGKGQRDIPVLLNVAPVYDAAGKLAGYVAAMTDLTEIKRSEKVLHESMARLERANEELRELNGKLEATQNQLLQSEKMASIGTLAAGVAHEINNPIGFVSSNLSTLKTYVRNLLLLIEVYEQYEADNAPSERIATTKREIDLDFMRSDAPALLGESADGLARVKKIVQDLKDFSRIDSEEKWNEEDIHKGLESTLTVVWNELKYTCEVRKEYGDLPPVECLLSQLNQVFMNLLVNAGQSIETKGTITIRTGTQGNSVWVEISDTGKGIAPENIGRIFDPFFTTKPVGKGTGLGLSVSYSIIQKHHGRIEVESEVGKGTTFRIWLPIRQLAAAA